MKDFTTSLTSGGGKDGVTHTTLTAISSVDEAQELNGSGRVRLGAIAVEISNPQNGYKMKVYALQDTGSKTTIVWWSVAKELDTIGMP